MPFAGGTCRPCSCRGHHSSIVGHCYWFVQNCGANGWWPAGYERGRRRASRYERESSGEDGDGDESPRSGHSGDEDDGVWYGGRDGGWNGASRSNYRGMPMKLIFYWEKCRRRWNAPDAADVACGSAYGARRDRRDLVDGAKYALASDGETTVRAERRGAPTAGQQRPRVVRGGDWF